MAKPYNIGGDINTFYEGSVFVTADGKDVFCINRT